MVNKARQFYEFGPFRIDPDHRQLWRENQPVPLQPKAFDILLVLVKNSERVVSKDDLMKTVWPETFVEESNLSQNIFVLRKTLGDAMEEKRYIVTVPGRGGADGSEPTGGLVLDADGESLYGVAQAGGNMNSKCQFPGNFGAPPGCGTIFRIDKTGKYTILYSFKDGSDGAAPIRLIRDDVGNLYGIAQWGANNCWRGGDWGCGTFFKLDTKGTFSVIFAYSEPSNYPAYSQALVRDNAGNLYGFKRFDGAHNNGYIYKLTPGGEFEDLYDISMPSTDGAIGTGMALDPSGN